MPQAVASSYCKQLKERASMAAQGTPTARGSPTAKVAEAMYKVTDRRSRAADASVEDNDLRDAMAETGEYNMCLPWSTGRLESSNGVYQHEFKCKRCAVVRLRAVQPHFHVSALKQILSDV
eukprot:6210432-Pleurochrysis_carterae.AAC.1